MDKWTQRFLEEAKHISEWSTCLRRKCGAIIVRDKQILSTGYNGAPAGCTNCLEKGSCPRNELGIPSGQSANLCKGAHAEQNAITQAARHGVCISGASMYMTTQPCAMCAKNIINAGIKEIHYIGSYPDQLSLDLMNEAGITIYQHKEE